MSRRNVAYGALKSEITFNASLQSLQIGPIAPIATDA